MPKIDFGNCYQKVKDFYSIDDDLTIVTLIQYLENNHITKNSLYNPLTSEKLEAEKICQNETITLNENILSILKEKNANYEFLMTFINQNIDIFNFKML